MAYLPHDVAGWVLHILFYMFLGMSLLAIPAFEPGVDVDTPVKGLALEIASNILNGFNRHFSIFSKITKGAKERFENADWDGEREASREAEIEI